MEKRKPRSNKSLVRRRSKLREDNIITLTVNNKPMWLLLKEFVNSLRKNQTFTRIQVLENVYHNSEQLVHYSLVTDDYLYSLAKAGFIEKLKDNNYKKNINIPINLPVHRLNNLAYTSTWEKWFIPLEERIKYE